VKDIPFRACEACGTERPAPLFSKDGYSIVQCRACGLVYVGEDPSAIDFASLYGEAYYRGDAVRVFADYLGEEKVRRASARRRVLGLRRDKWCGRLLDVGCAAGFFLVEAQRFYTVQGVELSDFSSRHARERFGLDVFTGTVFDAALPAQTFDVITLWDVIEHVAAPGDVLRECARLLKPDGRIVLTTGDIGSSYARRRGASWHLVAPPWHLYYFSRSTLAALADNAGLRVLTCRARGVASDRQWLRGRPAVAIANLFGLGDIMRVTLALRPRAAVVQ
jgi:SAM-dependent methyltransferase